MGLSNKREELLKEMPVIRTDVFKSKDGKWMIHRTSITHIKPVAYYKAVVEGTAKEEPIDDLAKALEA